MRRLKALYTWFDSRLQLGEPIKEMALHPVPNKTASWWYVFGSAAFVLLMLQIVTGILLALVYVPSAGQAWNSLNVLNHRLTLGWFLRAMHGWGSNFMVAVVLIHMAQVFLFGANTQAEYTVDQLEQHNGHDYGVGGDCGDGDRLGEKQVGVAIQKARRAAGQGRRRHHRRAARPDPAGSHVRQRGGLCRRAVPPDRPQRRPHRPSARRRGAPSATVGA